MKQLKGVVIGGEEATPRLQPQELVLVENLKVGYVGLGSVRGCCWNG